MNSSTKVFEYLDYLRRRETGRTVAGEHAYFHQLEKEVTEIINSLPEEQPVIQEEKEG